jgi:hypothetical protein
VIRNQIIAVVQLASDLETQERSKAMAEQGECLLSICMDYFRQVLSEQRKVTQERFITKSETHTTKVRMLLVLIVINQI